VQGGWKTRRLASPDFNQVGVTVGGEQSSVQTFLEEFNFQGFDIDPDHGYKAGHPISSLMMSVSNEGFP